MLEPFRQPTLLAPTNLHLDARSRTEHQQQLSGVPAAGAFVDSYADLEGGGCSMPLIQDPSQALGLLVDQRRTCSSTTRRG